jgi:hypothetical protein
LEKFSSYPLRFPKIGTKYLWFEVSSCRTPPPEAQNEFLVSVLAYKEMIHSLGGATETAEANVIMHMDVACSVVVLEDEA